MWIDSEILKTKNKKCTSTLDTTIGRQLLISIMAILNRPNLWHSYLVLFPSHNNSNICQHST